MARYRLFVSSPQEEFHRERQMLADQVRSDPALGRFFEVFLFEEQPATDLTPRRAYLTAVDQCDVYVGLFGETYGRAADPTSPTEDEFDRATAGRKTRFIFVKKGRDADRDSRMTALIRKAEQSVIRAEFTDAPSLWLALEEALVAHLAEEGVPRPGRFDEEVCANASLDDLGEEPFRVFLKRVRPSLREHFGDAPKRTEILANLDLLEDGRLTNAGILLFGGSPTKFLPSALVKCVQFHGSGAASPVLVSSFIEEPVLGAIDRATEFVMSRLNTRIGFRTESAKAPHYPEIPPEVVTEAIVNAVAHREYTSRASVQVMLFRDRLVICNPGRLLGSMTVSDLSQIHTSVPRNRLIVRALRHTRYMEEVGMGTVRMIEGCRKAGLPEPKFTVTSGFTVELSRRESWNMGFKEDRYRVMEDGGRRWREDTGGALGRVDRDLGAIPAGLKMQGV